MRHNAPFSKIEPAGRRGQWRRGLLLAAVAVLALAASVVMTPVPAEAQSTVTLVSNVNIGVQTTVLFGGSSPKYASSFTTGPAGGGYGLASVTLRLTSAGGSPTLDVAVHRDSSGAPGQRLFALDNPPTAIGSASRHIFGAPPGSRLTANTTYWVVAGTSSGRARLNLTANDDERPGKQPGWSIGDSLVSMSGPDASWVTDARSVQMAVQGVVVDSFVSNLGSWARDNEGLVVYGDLGSPSASKFTTGPNRGGYRLTSVTLRLRRNEEVPQGEIHLKSRSIGTATDCPARSSSRSTIRRALARCLISYSNYKFTAPTDADTRLPPNRSYWVVAFSH